MNISVAGMQGGMVLLLCLIFLTSLTLLGLSASADTILQTRLVANLQEAERAKQSALSALDWAEHWLLELNGPAPETCAKPCDGLFVHPPGQLPPNPETRSLSWWTEQGHEAGTDPTTGTLVSTISSTSAHRPLWILEVVHSVPPSENATGQLQVWYRILARGSGQSGTSVSVIESTIVRSWSSTKSSESGEAGTSATCSGAELMTKCGRLSWRELR